MKIQHKLTLIFSVLFYVPQLWAVYTYKDLQKAVDEQDTQSINTILDENTGFLEQKDIFKPSNRDYGTILHHAANSETNLVTSITVLIQRGADPMATDWQGNTPLHIAIQRGSDQSVTALIGAAREQNNPIDPNTTNSSGRAPLHIIANLPHPLGHESNVPKVINIINALVVAGADPNQTSNNMQDDQFGTPLHLLVNRNASIDVLNAFFNAALKANNPVNENAQDRNGDTPLHVAANKWIMHKEILEFLLKKGADIEAKNKTGQTPLHLAVSIGNQTNVETLIEQGASISTPDNQGKTPVHLLLDELTKITPNLKKVTAFVTAANKRNLTPPPIDLNATDSDGRTYVHRMVMHTPPQRVEVLKAFYTVIIPFLGQQPPKTNVQNKNGNTPLHIVAQSGDVEAMKVLVQHGESDFSIENNDQYDPLMTVLFSFISSPQAVLEFFTSAYNAVPSKIDMKKYLLAPRLPFVKFSAEKVGELLDFATQIKQPTSQETLNQMLRNATEKLKQQLSNLLIEKGAQVQEPPPQTRTDKPLSAPGPQKIILATALAILASIGLGVAYKKREQLKALWQKLKNRLVGQKPKKDAKKAAQSIF